MYTMALLLGRLEPFCFQSGPQEEKLTFKGIVLLPIQTRGQPLLPICMNLFVSPTSTLCYSPLRSAVDYGP